MTDLQREREMRTPQFLAVLSVITGWLAGSTVIFEDDFDAYRNSEEPSSIAEIRKTHWRFGEVIDGRYAINHGGNLHQLVMPGVSDFELSFTANPHPRAPFAPILIISFRLTEKKGYRLFHWFGPTWSRVDFHHWDRTADPPADSRLQSIMLPKFALPHAAPIRWRLRAKGNSFALSRNGKEIWSFVHKQGPEKQRGAIALDISTNTRDAVAPIYFDHLKVTTDEIEEVGKHVFRRTFTPPGQIRAMHVKTPFHIDARELRDTGLDRFWTDQPDGRVYRLDLSVDFPEIRGKGRDTAGLRPYVRLETTSGETIFERTIFEGIVGGVMPGRRSGAAMMTRLRNDYDAPKHYGWRVRNCRAADTTGPQKTAIYIPKLPSRFNVAVGWEDLLDADHVSAAGPLEAIFTSDGEPLYSGVPLREGAFSLELKTRPSAGILGRIPKDNQYYAGCVAQQEENHYFVEGEAPVFSVRCVASRRYRLPHIIEWQALDALLRPFPAKGRLNLKMPARGEEHPEWSGRRCIWTAGEIRPNVRHPGIYWLRLQYGGQKKLVCFSIVPGERKPGYTAAAASGLPEISGQFYPMQGWLKETAHYVASTGCRSMAWLGAIRAFNMKAILNGRHTPELIRKFDGIWGPRIPPDKTIRLRPSPYIRLWMPPAFNNFACIQAFLKSARYRPHPEDEPLKNPKTVPEERWRIITQNHFKEWIEYGCDAHAANDELLRSAFHQLNDRLDNTSYGPPLINTLYYGNLYVAKYYGHDWRQRRRSPQLVTTWQMETYPHNFGRPPESYTPSIALTKLGVPEWRCRWEIYGAYASSRDHRDRRGSAPNGLHWPSRNFMTHQVVEQSLGPWYFSDGKFHMAGNTNIGPGFGSYFQPMLLGFIDGLRIASEAQAVHPIKSPAFVRSYAAAELDPSWSEPSINNAAAEAPAFAYIQSRLAGLPGGFFLDIDDISEIKTGHCDLLVLPSMRGASPEQVQAIRSKYDEGVPLVCFDDCSGLEDLFGVTRLKQERYVSRVQRAKGDRMLQDLPRRIRSERLKHEGEIWYELDGAAEVLSAYSPQGERKAPLLTLYHPEGKPGAVFYTQGATEVGRNRQPLVNASIEGEVVSDLVRHAFRLALRAITRPALSVKAPASLLAFRRQDGSIYAVVQDSSWPYIPSDRGPVSVELSISGKNASSAQVTCEKHYEEAQSPDGSRTLRLELNPDEVVPMIISGLE